MQPFDNLIVFKKNQKDIMKTFRLPLLVIALAIHSFAFAQNQDRRNVRSFSGIKVGEAITVYIQSGSNEQVVVETSGVSPDEVLTEVNGGKLRIEMDGNRNYKNITVTVRVTYRSLEELEVSSAAKIISEGIVKADELSLQASSAGSMLLQVDANELDIEVSSSGDIELSGTADYQRVDAGSAGGYDGFDLISKKAKVSASSAGRIRVNTTENIHARASSGGSVRYKGNPEYEDTSSSSGGSVRRS
jgi:hypothetical protein